MVIFYTLTIDQVLAPTPFYQINLLTDAISYGDSWGLALSFQLISLFNLIYY